jgi:NAD+ kinase
VISVPGGTAHTLQAAIISKPQKPELEGILRDLVAWLNPRRYHYLLDLRSYIHLLRRA